MNKSLTLEQRVWNCAATLEAEFLHSTHSYYHARAMGVEEYSELWSRSDNISWAHGFGRMRGFASVWNGSVMLYDIMATQRLQQNYEVMPEIAGFDMRALMELSLHALATDIVEAADDRKSARAFFLTPGLISSAVTNNGKRRISGLWERYGADFVYEDGCWLYLHEHVCPNMMIPCDGENPGAQNYQRLKSPGDGPMGPGGPPPGAGNGPQLRTRPDCEDPGPLHNDWSVVQPVQNTVPWPEPYKTMDNDNTYTPFLS